MWNQEIIPQKFKDVTTAHLFKWEGNMWDCDNHRGIFMLSIEGKCLASFLLNHLNQHLKHDLLTDWQCRFCQGCGTAGMVFSARQLKEKCQEQNVSPYISSVHLTKGFKAIIHDGLWKVVHKVGCPDSVITLVRQFHDGMQIRVQDDGGSSQPFQ